MSCPLAGPDDGDSAAWGVASENVLVSICYIGPVGTLSYAAYANPRELELTHQQADLLCTIINKPNPEGILAELEAFLSSYICNISEQKYTTLLN